MRKSKLFTHKERLNAFAKKVDKRGSDECWPWLGAKTSKGYGSFWNGESKLGAHKISWQLFFGDIPEGRMVLHKCNNRWCVNPYHLYLGDAKDNSGDAIQSGTHSMLHNIREPNGRFASSVGREESV